MSRFQSVITHIRQWLRVAGSYLRLWMAPVVLGSIVVTVLAVKIQMDLADQEMAIQKESARQEMQRAAVSRSVALYRDFVGSEAVRNLRNVQHEIEHLIWQDDAKIKGSNEDKREEEKEKASILVYKKRKIQTKKTLIRKSLVGVLQRIKLIYACGNFREKYEKLREEQKTGESLCDKNTISTLLGGIFLDLFYPFRPVMYCDAFFKARYYQNGEKSGYIGMWESLVIEHMRRDMTIMLLGKSYHIYRTRKKHKTDIDKGKIGSKDKNFTVLRLTDKKCELYPRN